uniref:Regulatory protein E2 n=1 Tax=Human papillomavirus type 188 TaxID=1851213 RepID=A0A4P8PJE0_9PAPI|nr:E2 [Human papillomavirus type 188]
METQETLSARFLAQQDIQLTLIEKDSKNLRDHIDYWESMRKEQVLAYYAKKENMSRLGLQPLPPAKVSEQKAKDAIRIQLLLQSLYKSEFGSEPWTLLECSLEMLDAPPRNCFKKQPFTVTVLFDNDAKNVFPYICYEHIYYQDSRDKWHKVKGQVDHNGLYFKEVTGDAVYFKLFQPDSTIYGKTGQWTVISKNKTIRSSVTSSSRSAFGPADEEPGPSTSYNKSRQEGSGGGEPETSQNAEPSSSTSAIRLRRGRREREHPYRARKQQSHLGADSAPSPEEVGRRSQSVAKHGLSRLRRLQEEARDPPVLIITGRQNNLKCWRHRFSQKYSDLYECCSSAWKWLGPKSEGYRGTDAKLLIAFKSPEQRQSFLNTVSLPKNTTYSMGHLDSL